MPYFLLKRPRIWVPPLYYVAAASLSVPALSSVRNGSWLLGGSLRSSLDVGETLRGGGGR